MMPSDLPESTVQSAKIHAHTCGVSWFFANYRRLNYNRHSLLHAKEGNFLTIFCCRQRKKRLVNHRAMPVYPCLFSGHGFTRISRIATNDQPRMDTDGHGFELPSSGQRPAMGNSQFPSPRRLPLAYGISAADQFSRKKAPSGAKEEGDFRFSPLLCASVSQWLFWLGGVLNFINTPLQRGVANGQGIKNRFNGFRAVGETVKTVGASPAASVTLLKQGVNEIGTGMKRAVGRLLCASVPRWFNLLRLLRSFAAPNPRILRLNFINTPLQRGVANGQGIKNRFNGFRAVGETVKTVGASIVTHILRNIMP